MSNPEWSLDTNVVSRLRNLLTGTLVDNIHLPKMIVIVPNGDLINFYNHSKAGASRGLARLVDWIMREHNRIVMTHKEFLPDKAKRRNYPQFIWIEAPLHQNFNSVDNDLRERFNTCLRTISKSHKNTSVLELKKVWDKSNPNLYLNETIHSRFTAEGLKTYWLAVDCTLKFCNLIIMKRVAKAELKAATNKEPEQDNEDDSQKETSPP